MLQKQNRLPAHTKLHHPFSFTTPLFILKVSNNGLQTSRFAFVIRKALDKRATERNRMRRVFRSCIETMLDELKEGKDMLFLLKKGILEMRHEDLYNEVHTFLRERQLLK
ncbi:MAG TPA: ribonuclease P protein component [Methylomirabilota bacterium]|nr:ribonuclease P protein component [Methylomirabilota bacterium]